jgi:urease accessory protein
MRATARIEAVLDATGHTRLAVLSGEVPLLPRRTGPRPGPGEPAVVHLVGGAAGPLGGDNLTVDIVVGPGAALTVRTVAASIALPDRTGSPSHTRVHATVAAGARLEWLPEPLVAAARCDHHARASVRLAADAALVWRDELVCGRHGERPGDASVTTVVRRDGRPLLHHQLAVGPSAPGWAGSAVLDRARCAGTVLTVDPSWASGGTPPSAVRGETAARFPLAGPATLLPAVAPDAAQLRRALDDLNPAHAAIAVSS